MPNDVFEIIVNALAAALVADFQRDADAVVKLPGEKTMTLGRAPGRL